VRPGNLRTIFCDLLDTAGLPPRSGGQGPRLQDLRHTFAVRTLIGWYDAGIDVEPRLPLLSAYLGHVSPVSTYWYLSACPELLQAAARRLETRIGTLP
jgi:integrase/recombinase XerD